MRTELIDIGIDLGTANTRVYVRGKGIVIEEPSYAAVDKESRKAIAYGQQAKEMGGKAPSHILMVHPLRDGVLSDYDIIKGFLRYSISRACTEYRISSPSVILGIKLNTTEAERRDVYDAIRSAGAREAFLIEEPVAAAIGAGLPIQETRGSMIVDIGDGKTQVAIFSGGKIAVSHLISIAGNKMDKDIIQYMRNKHNLLIGERSAENAKLRGGSAYPLPEELALTLKGRDQVTGLPTAIEVSISELREALAGSVSIIVDTIRDALDETPPELISDLMESGICMTGGGSQLKGLAERVQEEVKVRAWVVEDALTCVARGIGEILEDYSNFRNYLVTMEHGSEGHPQ